MPIAIGTGEPLVVDAYSKLPNELVKALNDVHYAYGDTADGGSSGSTPDTIEQMARDAIAFMTALEVSEEDLLGFSIGSFVAQQVALMRAGHRPPSAVATPETSPEETPAFPSLSRPPACDPGRRR